MNYKKQRNLVVRLNKKLKRNYLHSLPGNFQNKRFWQECKAYFSEKWSKTPNNVVLIESEDMISKDYEVAKTFNKYFSPIVDSYELFEWECPESHDNGSPIVIHNIIRNYGDLPSIKSIENNCIVKSVFLFKPISFRFDDNKAVSGDIPLRILKENLEFSTYICNFIKEFLTTGVSPDSQKTCNCYTCFQKVKFF